ncbi:MAG: glycosyltransferase [Candidatus Marinimicrobia bacterium]|nr:glycosyltransferase [Candidatus Neomarinimicrobiota bacterium]MCF7827908.1 glycosyltransferase [Candidatus Neomarinimicrobiota bacterium]MCF7879337.1 glycosyltransferase [Candidatus Neomarinimicrobiota bacterium]
MKILYLTTENNAGTLEIWQRAHRDLGNEARYVTLFPNESQFPEDIHLDLPLTPNAKWLQWIKKFAYKAHGPAGMYEEPDGYPPYWEPQNFAEKWFFTIRDAIWSPIIRSALREYDLWDFDIYHLEGGIGFFRDARVIQDLSAAGKHIVCSYHGTDLRLRGVIPAIDAVADVNITSELDLLEKHPNIEYVFLPFETTEYEANYDLHSPIRMCHATRNRYFKGSSRIIQVCEQIASERDDAEFVLIENRPHDETLELKASSDVYIDQISNTGGWGYGMNSVESLSMGLCCCTNLIQQYEEFLPDHPFVNVSNETLYEDLNQLLDDPEKIRDRARYGKRWVEKYHDVKNVIRSVYMIYHREGWIDSLPWGNGR